MTLEKLQAIYDEIANNYTRIFQIKARATFFGIEPNSEHIENLENKIKELEKLIKTEI